MAKLTRTDIEGGEIIQVTKITTQRGEDDFIYTYKIKYKIDEYNYRIILNYDEEISNEDLKTNIYLFLIDKDKFDPSSINLNPKPTIEINNTLIGQVVTDPDRG